MTDQSLREALEQRLGTLPVMQHDNGYPVQALPKAELLSLLAAHPAEPAPADVKRGLHAEIGSAVLDLIEGSAWLERHESRVAELVLERAGSALPAELVASIKREWGIGDV